MNNVIQFSAGLTPAGSATAVATPIPILVPEGRAFKVRNVDFRWLTYPTADIVISMGLSRFAEEPIQRTIAVFLGNPNFMAYASFGFGESGTTGESSHFLNKKVELWDLDYKLVMRPTFHILQNGAACCFQMFCVLSGELVPASEGERNAIIAWQGGAK